jgi:hypothetical protein
VIWERFLDYELGHLQVAMQCFKDVERRDPAEVVPTNLPEPIEYKSHRSFVREVLEKEVDLRARGTQFIPKSKETKDSPSVKYREQLNSEGSPTETVAAGYIWKPGTELNDTAPTLAGTRGGSK